MAETLDKRITLKAIAEMAGVDKSLVSKVIRNKADGEISLEKRQKIEALVQKYQYAPLGAAQSLATNRTGQIAFLLSEKTFRALSNETFSQMLCGVVAACHRFHYQCQVDICDFSNLEQLVMPDNLKKSSIDGCILTGAISESVFPRISEMKIPFVVLGQEDWRKQVPVISRSRFVDYEIFLRYCLEKGHSRLWVVSVSDKGKEQYRYWVEKMPGLQVEISDARDVASEYEVAEQLAEKFLKLRPEKRPTLLCGNDQFCCAFTNILLRNGLNCPRDFSIVSSSETDMAVYYNPSLTTYSPDFYWQGECGVEVLIRMLEERLDLAAAIKLADSCKIESKWKERDSVKVITPEE